MELGLARYWWLLALRGVLTAAFGLVTVLWPDVTLEILALLFGAYMLVDGIFAIGAMVVGQTDRERWFPMLLEGLAGIVIGALALWQPEFVIRVAVYLIAAWAFVTGIFQIVVAIRLRQYIEGDIWLFLSGLFSVVLGVLLAVAPDQGAEVLAIFLGAYAIVAGLLLIGVGFQLRNWRPRQA